MSPSVTNQPPQRIAGTLLERLRIKQLHLLVSIGQHRSLRKAALELSMTLSAASKSLQEIETSLGAVLFERRRDGLHPNLLGECAIAYAQVIRKDINAMCDELAELQTGQGGKVRLGAIMGALPLVMATLTDMVRLNAELSVEVCEDTSARMLNMLESDQLDVVIGRTSVSVAPENFNYLHVAEERISVAAGYGHEMAAREALKLSDLKGYAWISFPSQMPLNILLRQELERTGLNEASFPVETASTFVTAFLLKENPHLLAFLPTTIALQLQQQKMVSVLNIDLPQRAQPFGIITYKKRNLTAATRTLIQALQDHIPAASASGRL